MRREGDLNNYCGKNMRISGASTGGGKSNLGLDRRKDLILIFLQSSEVHTQI